MLNAIQLLHQVQAAAEPASPDVVHYCHAWDAVLRKMLSQNQHVVNITVPFQTKQQSVTFHLVPRYSGFKLDPYGATKYLDLILQTKWRGHVYTCRTYVKRPIEDAENDLIHPDIVRMIEGSAPSLHMAIPGRQLKKKLEEHSDLPSQPQQVLPFLARVFLSEITSSKRVQAAAEPSSETDVYDPRSLTPRVLVNAINAFQGRCILESSPSGAWSLGTGGSAARIVSGGGQRTGVAVFTVRKVSTSTGRFQQHTVPHRVQLQGRTITVLTRLAENPAQMIGTKSSAGLSAHAAALFVLGTLRTYLKARPEWFGQRNS